MNRKHLLSKWINKTPFQITNFKNDGRIMEDTGGECNVMEKALGSN